MPIIQQIVKKQKVIVSRRWVTDTKCAAGCDIQFDKKWVVCPICQELITKLPKEVEVLADEEE